MDSNLQHPANQPDEYVSCPYFPEHQLRKSRLPYHLQKCQKNPRAPNLVACPYNYMHRIRHEDREDHLIFCEDKVNFKFSDRKPASFGNTLKDHFKIDDQSVLLDQGREKEKNKTLIAKSLPKNDEEEYW